MFGAPGQFGHRLGMHHAAAALERMQGTAHFSQCLALLVVGTPAQPVALDFRQQLTGLVEEHFTQLVIDAISAAIAARGGLDQRAVHPQRRKAGARHVDEGLAIRQWVRHPPLQVAFGGAQGLGQVRQLIGWGLHLQVLQPALHIAGATGKQLGHGW